MINEEGGGSHLSLLVSINMLYHFKPTFPSNSGPLIKHSLQNPHSSYSCFNLVIHPVNLNRNLHFYRDLETLCHLKEINLEKNQKSKLTSKEFLTFYVFFSTSMDE